MVMCHCMQVSKAAASSNPLLITGEQGLDLTGLAAQVHGLASKQQVSKALTVEHAMLLNSV
jgi:transcriptional regulator with AAA-type ATPase domain